MHDIPTLITVPVAVYLIRLNVKTAVMKYYYFY